MVKISRRRIQSVEVLLSQQSTLDLCTASSKSSGWPRYPNPQGLKAGQRARQPYCIRPWLHTDLGSSNREN